MITPDLLHSLLSTSTPGQWDSNEPGFIGAGDRRIAMVLASPLTPESIADAALMALARELAEAWLRIDAMCLAARSEVQPMEVCAVVPVSRVYGALTGEAV